jgi:Mlc titration factor MtfA (ptsG expression regulator)
MAHRIIDSEADLEDFIRLARGFTLPMTFEWTPGRDRSLEQNRLQFLWAREAAEQLGDRTTDEVRCDWKLRHGVPIMREDSPEFQETYDTLIRPLTFEQKLKAMQIIEVTSLMKVRQMVRYLDTVQRECLENGIQLTDPDPGLASYQARYRERKAA